MNTVSAGFAHSAAINHLGQLYVWGDNRQGQLGGSKDEILEVPTEVLLKYEGREYQATSVSCGAHFTIVACRCKQDLNIRFEPQEEEIL